MLEFQRQVRILSSIQLSILLRTTVFHVAQPYLFPQFGNIFRAHTTALTPKGGISERLKKRKAASAAGVKK
jgi:hypothetical protein